jgi:DnaK suppressor protein
MDMRNQSFDRHLLLQFRSGLREQQRDLLRTIENAEKEIRDFSAPVPLDPIDLSGFTASKESLFARASQDRGRLRLIQRALERISDGSFGICVECEGPIGLKRLQALPWASHCIQCQEQAEVARLAGNLNLDLTLLHSVRDSGT